MRIFLFALLGVFFLSTVNAQNVSTPAGYPASVTVNSDGTFQIRFKNPSWDITGESLKDATTGPISNLRTRIALDAVGEFFEQSFDFPDGSATASIRTYATSPVVKFTHTRLQAGSNPGRIFPRLTTYPQAHEYSFNPTTAFSQPSFQPRQRVSVYQIGTPLIRFDDKKNTMIFSPANNFLNAGYKIQPSGGIVIGVDNDPTKGVLQLPAGLVMESVLVATPGINKAYEVWGNALMKWNDKTRPANDASPELKKFGYFTDNAATYYYNVPAKDREANLIAIRDAFLNPSNKLPPISYMQMDSWWYPKGAGTGYWNPPKVADPLESGINRLVADPVLFPNGLANFRSRLGLPLMAHARWISTKSSYRERFTLSNNVSTDQRYWQEIAIYMKANGITTFEQDWMHERALPLSTNLRDQENFLGYMSQELERVGIKIQYCMPMTRHYLESVRYPNVWTLRVSDDGFNPTLEFADPARTSAPRWKNFLFTSRLANAVGAWPWSDAFFSQSEGSTMLSLLSAGMFAVGDAIRIQDTTPATRDAKGVYVPARTLPNALNLSRAVRTDGVIVKPDTSIVPIDSSYINEAYFRKNPIVAAATTRHSNLTYNYVFGYADTLVDNSEEDDLVKFTPAELGYQGDVYIYDFRRGIGARVAPASVYSVRAEVDGNFSDVEHKPHRYSYLIVSPIGKSGIAFLGDADKYAALGKKRISSVVDAGELHVNVVYAPGEGPVKLHGYSPSKPNVTALKGRIVSTKYDSAKQRFEIVIEAAAGAVAEVNLKL